MLLPRELDLVAAGKQMPLPLKKPLIPEDDDKKDEAKTDDGKSKPEAAKTENQLKHSKKSRRQAGPARPKPRS